MITREACALMRAKVGSILLLDESRQWLDLRASHGAGPAYVSKPRLSANESLLGVVVRPAEETIARRPAATRTD